MMANVLLLLAIILVALLGFVKIKKYIKLESAAGFPYQTRTILCSQSERSLLGLLDQLLGAKCRIFVKVRLADLLEVKKGISNSIRQRAFNRISGKHVDFVICDKKDLSILGVIELDDRSHESAKRQARDKFLDSALNAAGIPICHIQAQRAYSLSEIRKQLQSGFEFLTKETETNSVRQDTDTTGRDKIQTISVDTEKKETCAYCGAPLVKRQATKGKFAGKYVLACSNYPKCRKIVLIS